MASDRTAAETIRRVRLSDLKRLFHHRYGHVLPDDDAGRDDLEELLMVSVDKNLPKVISVWAPWLPEAEAARMVGRITSMPLDMRWSTPEGLGKRLRVTNAERERLKLWQIKPCDMSDADIAEYRRAKQRDRARTRARERREKREREGKSREAYLKECEERPRPWVAEGIHKATWYRRRARLGLDQTTETTCDEAWTRQQRLECD